MSRGCVTRDCVTSECVTRRGVCVFGEGHDMKERVG